MKHNPFYEVSGEVVVAAQGHDGNVTAWVTYCEDPTHATQLDFDSTGIIANEMSLDEFMKVPINTWSPCVLRLANREVLILNNIAPLS
jgi:hypothetical protein